MHVKDNRSQARLGLDLGPNSGSIRDSKISSWSPSSNILGTQNFHFKCAKFLKITLPAGKKIITKLDIMNSHWFPLRWHWKRNKNHINYKSKSRSRYILKISWAIVSHSSQRRRKNTINHSALNEERLKRVYSNEWPKPET